MAIPRHIRKAAQDADKLLEKVYGNKEVKPQTTPATTPAPEDRAAQDATPGTSLEGQEDSGYEESGIPRKEAPQQAEVGKDPFQEPAAEATPETKKEQTQQPDPWEARFKVLQGKYNAEVPRLHQENRTLREQIQSLGQQIEQLKAAPPAKPEPAPDFKRVLDELGLDEESGATLDSYIRGQIQAATGKVTETVNRFQKQTEAQREQGFWDAVYKAIPDYDGLAYDPDISEWLNGEMPMTGQPRRAFLDQAFAKKDAKTYTSILGEWRKAKQSPDKRTIPESKVTPSKARGDTTPSSKPTYTAAQYQQRMREAERLSMKGYRDRASQIMKEMDRALSEGRVKPS